MFDTYCEHRYVCCLNNEKDGCKIRTRVYTFNLPKNNHRYMVHVEEYIGDVFILKFFNNNHRLSKNRYNILTGDNQAPTIISTIFMIMLEIHKEISTASFAFMGSPIIKNGKKEDTTETKRLRVYKRFIHNRLGEETFEFLQGVDNSIYFIKNKSNFELSHKMEIIGKYLYDNYEDFEIRLTPVLFDSQSG